MNHSIGSSNQERHREGEAGAVDLPTVPRSVVEGDPPVFGVAALPVDPTSPLAWSPRAPHVENEYGKNGSASDVCLALYECVSRTPWLYLSTPPGLAVMESFLKALAASCSPSSVSVDAQWRRSNHLASNPCLPDLAINLASLSASIVEAECPADYILSYQLRALAARTEHLLYRTWLADMARLTRRQKKYLAKVQPKFAFRTCFSSMLEQLGYPEVPYFVTRPSQVEAGVRTRLLNSSETLVGYRTFGVCHPLNHVWLVKAHTTQGDITPTLNVESPLGGSLHRSGVATLADLLAYKSTMYHYSFFSDLFGRSYESRTAPLSARELHCVLPITSLVLTTDQTLGDVFLSGGEAGRMVVALFHAWGVDLADFDEVEGAANALCAFMVARSASELANYSLISNVPVFSRGAERPSPGLLTLDFSVLSGMLRECRVPRRLFARCMADGIRDYVLKPGNEELLDLLTRREACLPSYASLAFDGSTGCSGLGPREKAFVRLYERRRSAEASGGHARRLVSPHSLTDEAVLAGRPMGSFEWV